MIELLAPCGDMNKLKTAIHFGADAVYVGGNNYGLRRGAKNFSNEQLKEAVDFVHANGKKLYVTCNIVAHNEDFEGLAEYLQYLDSIKVDAVIVSDPGIIMVAREVLKYTQIHLSTQANATNKHSVKFWADQGCSRIVLARELSIDEITEIKSHIGEVELEAFVHGAMCIAHSGRCLLSNYLTKRDGNRGGCVQACRWEYTIHEVNRPNSPMPITEDERGTYIMNSRDLNMLQHVSDLAKAGVTSFKIEGRMKSQYYVGTVIAAYRKAIDAYLDGREMPESLEQELVKTSHRDYTTGFYYGNTEESVNLDSSKATCDYDFIAEIIDYDEERGGIIVEQRNRFKVGDSLEVLSADEKYYNSEIIIEEIITQSGESIDDAKLVQQVLFIKTSLKLTKHDILRKRVSLC